jgi:hypothetical protein
VTSDERATRARPRRRARRGAALALGAFVASLSSSAASQPAAPAGNAQDDFLVWHAPAGCSTAAAIRERVSDLLGQPELDLRHVRRVEGRVSETRDGWVLHLTLVDAAGKRERQLASPHCADLAEAAAVAISLAFEAARARELSEQAAPLEPARAAPPSTEPPPSVTTPATPAPDGPARAAPEARAGSALQPGFGAELWLDAHALPSVAAGASLVAALRAGDLRLGAFAGWLPGVDQNVGPGQSVHFSLLLGGVRACYTLGRGVIDTALCAGFEAGRLSARGAGLLSARNAADLWLAPQLGLELASALSSHLALQLRADAISPLLRQGYAVNETDDVHHVASLGVRAAFGFLVGF